MKLKLDDKGIVVVQDGKPVYLTEDGKEVAFDAPATKDTISRLNNEAKTHRERAEAAETKLKLFDGIDDPEKARKAIETVKNFDDKKLIDAGEVEKVKKEAQDAYAEQIKAQEKKYQPVITERDSLKSQLHHEKLSTAFGRSKFIADKLAIPVDLAQAKFGTNFQVMDDGKIRAKGADGNLVYSRANPGNPADFDEAFEILVDAYPYRDNILKGSGASGGGAGGTGGGAGGGKQVTRAQFDAMTPAEQSKAARESTITD
jgi:Mn-dependent DtxR family transcriptional regulator